MLRMNKTDLIALSSAFATLLGIVISGILIAWQVRRQWLLNSANLVTSLVDRFNSPEWEARRTRFITLLSRDESDTGRTLAGNYGLGVLGTFEHIAHLTRIGALDLGMVHNKFGWEIVCYYQLIRGGKKDLVGELRRQYHEPGVYSELEWLNEALIKKFKKHGTDVYDSNGRVHWMSDFIAQEKMLTTDRSLSITSHSLGDGSPDR